jgi:ferredoxin-NADP reductase
MRWQVATVRETVPETIRATTLRLDASEWTGHRAGQHVDVRLTAEDGYTAQRSYSIASRPASDILELTVVRIDDGEVSPYLTTILEVGDELELRGPIGGYFVWDPTDDAPTLLVGGGSGVVPLMAMLRHHAAIDHRGPVHLLYSARTEADVLYRDELEALAGANRAITVTLTREVPDAPGRRQGRVTSSMLEEVGWPPTTEPACFVCGPTEFVESVAAALVGLGHNPVHVRTERFGPTGG